MTLNKKHFAVIDSDGAVCEDFTTAQAASQEIESRGLSDEGCRVVECVLVEADDYAEMIELIESLVMQGCHYTGDRKLESNFISAYADGLRWLAKFGRVKLEEDAGRFVTARIIDPATAGEG